jgi:hypothetical protein
VRTYNNAGIEPIDSLQIKFNVLQSCGNATLIEVTSDKTVTISPNPASDFISVEFDSQMNNEIQYQMCGLNGNLIFEGKLQSDSKIDLKTLNPGAYLIKVKIDEVWMTQKIIKE